MKALRWVAFTLGGSVTLTVIFWAFQPDIEIKPSAPVVLNQAEGESIDIDVPVENYAQALQDFTLRAEIRNQKGRRINQTDAIQYESGMNYKFVTNRGMPRGIYEAHVMVGYRLNPIRSSELDFPLAIIHVEQK